MILDKTIILWALFSIFLGSFGVQSLIGAIKGEVYTGGTKRQGIGAVIWGIGYFLLFAAFASTPLLLFKDYGYSQEAIIGWSAVVLIISILVGFLWEKRLRQNFLPTYEEDDAENVTFNNLPQNIQQMLSKEDVSHILALEFEYQLSKNWQQLDEALMRAFIIRKMSEKGRIVSNETVQAVIQAEEVYLKQIGILGGKKVDTTNQTSNKTTLDFYIGRGFWRVVSIGIIIGAILFVKPSITLWFNDILFIKKAISVEKIPFKTTLAIVPYYEQLQANFPSYVKYDNLDNFIQISFAQYYLDQKKFDQALNYIQKALEIDSKFLPAYTTYGHYFIDQGEADQAIEKYQLGAQVNKDVPVVNASLCWGYYNKQEIERAIDYCQKALKIDPKYGLVYGYLVRLYAQNDDNQKAVESYQKANRYGVDKSYVHYYAALAYKELNQLNDAISAINKSLDKDPKNMDAYILSSEIRYLLGDKKEAIERLERVAAKNPEEAKILDYLGTLYKDENRVEEAIQTYKEALSVSDEEEEKALIYENLGLVYHNYTKQFDLAEKAFKNALKYDPKQATIYINLGETYRAKGMLKEAATQQRIALQLEPENALAHNNLGYTLALQGNIAEAVGEFKKALKIDPDLTIAKENLENFQEK